MPQALSRNRDKAFALCISLGMLCKLGLSFCGSRSGCAISLADDTGGRSHSDAIRAICFSADGALFASAGDDKLVKVWKTDSWSCIRTM